MSRRYDSRTTTFSPEGRLFQVEYAMEAISKAAAAIGIHTKEGVVLGVEKTIQSRLLVETEHSDKINLIDDHIICAVAGLTSDANILLDRARVSCQQHLYTFQEPKPVEKLVEYLCTIKQSYTQNGGLRPFGASFIYAGYDKYHGFQLYQSDPSGNYSGWKATAIGTNNNSAKSMFQTLYDENMSLDDAIKLGVRVICKCTDTSSPSSEKMEFATLTLYIYLFITYLFI